MRITIFVFLTMTSLSYLCAQTTTAWGMLSWGNTGAIDIVEVENGYISGVGYGTQGVVDGVFTVNAYASLVKFNEDLILVDSVYFPAMPDHNIYIHSTHLVGDSVYVLTFQMEIDGSVGSIRHWSIHSFDTDLNRGNRHNLSVDSSVVFIEAMLYEDSSFFFTGVNRNIGFVDSVFVFKHLNLQGAILSDTALSYVTLPVYTSLWSVPNSNQIVINRRSNWLIYYNMQNFSFDSIVASPNDIRQINTVADGLNLGVHITPNELTSYVAFDDDGALDEFFVIDTTFSLKNRSLIARPFGNAVDFDTVNDALYIANLHHYYFDGPGPSPRSDTLIVDLIIHKVNPIDRSIIWKKTIEITNATGIDQRHASLTGIRATSDGGSVVAFQTAANSMSGSVLYLIKLGPNGELLSRNDFELEKPALRLYPNPVTSQLSIESDDFPVFVSIADLNGKIVFNEDSLKRNHSVNVEAWTKGVYFIYIRGENGYSTIKKVVVK
jgi:hypothetical protein